MLGYTCSQHSTRSRPRPAAATAWLLPMFTQGSRALQSTGGEFSEASVLPFRTIGSTQPRAGSKMLSESQGLELGTSGNFLVLCFTVAELAPKPQDKVLSSYLSFPQAERVSPHGHHRPRPLANTAWFTQVPRALQSACRECCQAWVSL